MKKLSVLALLALAAAQAGAALVTLSATATGTAFNPYDAWGLTGGSHVAEFSLVYDNSTAASASNGGLYANAIQSFAVRFDGGNWQPQTVASSTIFIADSTFDGSAFNEFLSFYIQFASPGVASPSTIDFSLSSSAATSLAGEIGGLSDGLLSSLDATRFAGFQNNSAIASLRNPTGSSYGSWSTLYAERPVFSMTTADATQDVPEPASSTLAGLAFAAVALGSRRRPRWANGRAGGLTLRLRRASLLAATLTLTATAHAVTFSSEITLNSLNGSTTPGGYAASNAPMSRSLASATNSGLNGSTGVDLGVLRVSASTPAWDGVQSTPYNYYQSQATTGYTDTLTFTRAGGGMVAVSFSFAFDGSVLDPATSARRANLGLQMTVSGITGAITTPATRDHYFRDGLRDSFYDNYPQFAPCRAGNPAFGQPPLICQQNSYFSYSSSGDKVGTATFSFSVLSGQPVSVLTAMTAFAYSDPYVTSAASYDFSHTATLSAIATPAGTGISSALVGNLTAANGGVTYAPAIAAAVPEPATNLMLLAGLAGVAVVGLRRRRQPRILRPQFVLSHAKRSAQ